MLDESFSGVLVSDLYAAYHHYPGLKQRCWAHLLRDIHDLKILYPKERQLARWAAAVQDIYRQAKGLQPSRRWAKTAGPRVVGAETAGPVPSLRPRPGSRPRQPVPTYREAHQGTICLCGRPGGALGQQRCGKEPAAADGEPEGQRRHPLGAGHRHQDDPGLPLRHLAHPRIGSPLGLPSDARIPSTLNCYSAAADGLKLLRRAGYCPRRYDGPSGPSPPAASMFGVSAGGGRRTNAGILSLWRPSGSGDAPMGNWIERTG